MGFIQNALESDMEVQNVRNHINLENHLADAKQILQDARGLGKRGPIASPVVGSMHIMIGILILITSFYSMLAGTATKLESYKAELEEI